MAITDSLDAATAAVLALLAKINVSTARTIVVQDVGTADNYVFSPSPAVASYGADLLIVADIANANTTTTPKANVSGLGWLTIVTADNKAMPVGGVNGKCLFALSSATGGGYTLRMLSVNQALINALIAAATSAPTFNASGLLVGPPGARLGWSSRNNVSNPLAARDGSWTAFVVGDGNGNNITIGAGSDTVNLSNPNGAGGFDNGSPAANTPNCLFVITHADGSSPRLIGSASTVKPNPMPANYTLWGLASPCLIVDPSGNLRQVNYRDRTGTFRNTSTTAYPELARGIQGTFDLYSPTLVSTSLSALLTSKAWWFTGIINNSYQPAGQPSNFANAQIMAALTSSATGPCGSRPPVAFAGAAGGQGVIEQFSGMLEGLMIWIASGNASCAGWQAHSWIDGI